VSLTKYGAVVNEEFIRFIHRLSDESAHVIKPHFAALNFEVEMKDDETPVTLADRQAEEVMRDLIRREFPNHGIIGEEYGSENEAAEFVWMLDPIDGTISFASGCPLFGTLICLLHEERPILGAINQPILDLLCLGDNNQTTVNGNRVQMRTVDKLSEATLLTTDVLSVPKYQEKAGFENLVQKIKYFRTWGDCYGYLLLAFGGADIMLDPIVNPWDILPVIPIIQGADGVITSWDGGDAARGTSCVAANKRLHPLVMEILQT
jgi:histidinol phosphatase-like enzyme (inositol monophosphatase family)